MAGILNASGDFSTESRRPVIYSPLSGRGMFGVLHCVQPRATDRTAPRSSPSSRIPEVHAFMHPRA
jgi:hypothetical protein